MNYGSEPADQVVRYSLEGAEFALRISGTAAKNFFIFAQAVLHDSKKTHGKTHVSGINRPIYPIAFIKYKTAIGISAAVCCFSPAGRKKIHDNLEMDTTLFAYLREHPPEGHSLEYADCRLSLLSAQKGKCAVSGEWFLQPDNIVCHMKIPKEQGGQERYSNLVLLHRRYLPLLTDQDAATLKSICKQLTVTRKQLTKINSLRTAAKLAAI